MESIASPMYGNVNPMRMRATRYSIFGAIIAGMAIIIATSVTGYLLTGDLDLVAFATAQKTNPALWILDGMPFFFAYWGQKVSLALTQNVNALVKGHTEELRKKTEALERQAMHDATHDPLTDLPNRMLLRDRLEQSLIGSAKTGDLVALLVLDLDRFKEINDTLGHHSGDRLLKQIAIRLREIVSATDTLARLGGDEFAILISSLTDKKDIFPILQKIQRIFANPFVLSNLSLDVQSSIGVAIAPEHGKDMETLLQRADIAMYVAKEGRKSFHVYAADLDKHNSKRLSLIAQLRQAIETGDMRLHFQPKIESSTGDVQGVEALIRWSHPEFGMVPPDEFIHLAEQSGLINELTHWVLRNAAEQCALWRTDNLLLNVAVNLSPSSLLDPEFPDFMAGLLADQSLPCGSLTLEITETTLVRDPDLAMAVLNQLAALGIAISIDDFGTGYSSLAYLKKMPAAELKIDKTFVQDMLEDDSDAAIVRATIDLAHNLGMRVVAEGVESEAMAQALKTLNCDTLQGFLFSKPLAVDAFETWIHKRLHERCSNAA